LPISKSPITIVIFSSCTCSQELQMVAVCISIPLATNDLWYYSNSTTGAQAGAEVMVDKLLFRS